MSLLSEKEYRIQLQNCHNLAMLSRGIRVTDVLETMDRAETLGPILDPTLYQQAAESLEEQRKIVRLVLEFQCGVERLVEQWQSSTDKKCNEK